MKHGPAAFRIWAGLMLAGSVLAGCSPQEDASRASPEVRDPGVVHVHGLGINPADGVLYVATHTGLFRIPSPGRAERVGESYRDIMGFTVVGSDRFLGSGHPGAGEPDLPPLLGLMETTDAGITWEPVSLLGEADFHALRHAHERIYGYDSTGSRLMVSADGMEWDVRSEGTVLLDVAVSPDDPDRIFGTTEQGLVASEDGGRTWGAPRLDGSLVVYLSWAGDGTLWGLDIDGEVLRSDDAGTTWETMTSLGGGPEAIMAHETGVFAAVHGAGILRSDDGLTWETLHQEPA